MDPIKYHHLDDGGTRDRGTFERWRGQITPQMRALMDAVGAAMDRGIFYNSDMNLAVTPLFDWGAATMPADGREGGAISYEIYSARRQVEAERSEAREQATFVALALQPGQKLGKLRLFGQRMQTVRNAVVVTAAPHAIVMTATSGGRRYNLTMSAYSVNRSIEAAKPQAPLPPGPIVIDIRGPRLPAPISPSIGRQTSLIPVPQSDLFDRS